MTRRLSGTAKHSLKQRCDNCHYFRDPDETCGRCHRYAPKPYSFFRYHLAELLRSIAWAQSAQADTLPEKTDTHDDLNTDATEAMMTSAWPEVDREGWCGEWKKKLRPAAKRR